MYRVIVYKEDARTFHDIAADMLARAASVELTVQGAVDYLKSNKMIGKAKYNRCDELLEDAAKIRKKLLTSLAFMHRGRFALRTSPFNGALSLFQCFVVQSL